MKDLFIGMWVTSADKHPDGSKKDHKSMISQVDDRGHTVQQFGDIDDRLAETIAAQHNLTLWPLVKDKIDNERLVSGVQNLLDMHKAVRR